MRQKDGVKTYGTKEDADLFAGPKRLRAEGGGFTRTEVAIDILSLMFAEVQHMGALTAIYCHSEDKGLGMTLASKFSTYIHKLS